MFQCANAPPTVYKWISASVSAALMVTGLLVWQPSYAAFSSPTLSPPSNLTVGSVSLSDDDSSTAMFTAVGLQPGSTGARCIVVTSAGTLASTVKLYATGYSDTNEIGSYLHLVVDQGAGDTFATSGPTSCSGFSSGGNAFTGTLAGFAAGNTDFASGVGSWAPTGSGSVSKTFRFAYTLDEATPNSAQGGTASAGLTWEAQNN